MQLLRLKTFAVLLLTPLLLLSCATGREQRSPKNPASYHYQMGLSYLGERNYTSALVELTEAEKLDPDNPDLLYNLAMAYIGKKRPDLAEQKLQRALILKPNFSAARNDLGYVYLEMKRWDNAIAQFRIAKDDLFYDKSENAAINLGLAYLGKGEYQKALDELHAVAADDPRNPIVHLSIGRVLFAMDRVEQAVAAYRKAIDIYSDYGAAYYHLGVALVKQKKLDEARAAFNQVLRIFPDSDLGRSSVGYLELIK